ncbi:TolC family protein [Fulvivirga lutimaris]|uniref:TolC family protein n=1 Tax=Fulvivirga lutimaris TaxID=1819566 RepID=UPI0012BC1CCC|nr:TolC family protein [Fulvivirga lutimaris]MTI39021.1 hypothetical protein [Fulvivirga lutimaris]
MRKITLLSILIALSFVVSNGQDVDYNTIVLPANLENVGTQEKLVQLAWQNFPENKKYQEQILIAQEDLKQDNRAWLTNFGVSGNANEFVINDNADVQNRAQFFPKYNFSARLNLGLLFVAPSVKRENQARIRMAEYDLNSQKLAIRQQVLSAYQDVQKFLELYRIQLEVTDDSYSNYLLAEQKFQNGQITLDEFNIALQKYNTQKKEKIITETNYLKSKYQLEFFIGMKLEEAI